MKLICIKNNRTLVKGSVYECIKLTMISTGPNKQWFRPYVTLKYLGNHTPDHFTLEDGNPLPQTNWVSPSLTTDFTKTWIEKPELLGEGDIIVCTSEGSKFLKSGDFYKISKIRKEHVKGRWWDVKVCLEGYNRWLSTRSFRLPTPGELREISLDIVLEQKTPDMKIDPSVRKFDRHTQERKAAILINLLMRSYLDVKRNNLNVIDWAIQKVEPKLNLTREDFLLVENYTLGQIGQLS